MSFVKLDSGLLGSTLWGDKNSTLIFITALLLAEPREFREPIPEIATNTTKDTGWTAPAGWYGFVPFASHGIIRFSGLDMTVGMEAIRQLAAPDDDSRSKEHDGRRMIRIDGGFIILNYDKYRERDYTTADRSKRYRERRKAKQLENLSANADASDRHGVTSRRVTQAEAEAEAEAERRRLRSSSVSTSSTSSSERTRQTRSKNATEEPRAQNRTPEQTEKAKANIAKLRETLGTVATAPTETRHTTTAKKHK